MAAPDSFEAFDRLCAGLRRDGFPEEAQVLHDLVHRTAWTTGSELMGELGLAIERIKAQRLPGLSLQTRRDMAAALTAIRRVWPFPKLAKPERTR